MRAIILLVLSLLMLWDSSPSRAQEVKPLKVGAILPLTGQFAFLGEAFRQGIVLGLSEVEESKFSVIFEDECDLDRTKAVSAFHKLKDIDDVQAILEAVVNTVYAYAPLANKHEILSLVLWDSNHTIDKMGDYIFGFGFSTELAGEDMAEFALRRLNANRIAIISAHDEWSEIISGSFGDKFRSLSGQVVAHEKVNVADSDLKSVILKIMAKKPQAIYAPLFLPL